MSGVVGGVDIGGTTTQAVICDGTLTVLARAQAPTPARSGGDAMVEVATRLLRGLIATTGHRLTSVAVGAAGVVDAEAGRVLVTSDSFQGWAGFEVVRALVEALAVPAYLDNDVNAFLRAEATAGALAGVTHGLGITLGTGVGGALWLDGAVYAGLHGAAGEIGHVPGFGKLPCTCGGRGHLETLASGRAIVRRYAELTGRLVAGAHEVAAAADRGDSVALRIFTDAGVALGRAILMTAGLLDLPMVVVGGGVSSAWHLLHPAIEATLATEPPVSGERIQVVRAALGADAVAVGACARALADRRRTPPTAAAGSYAALSLWKGGHKWLSCRLRIQEAYST